MLPSLSAILVNLLNAAIQENREVDLANLEGRSLAISIDECPQDIAFHVENQQLKALDEDKIHTADVTISGNIKAIINMLQDESTGLDNDELYITGKISTAKYFQHFLASLSLNWQRIFQKVLPEPIAEKMGDAVTQGIHFTKEAVEQCGEQLRDYIVNEKRHLVKREEVKQLAKDIQSFTEQLDSLAKKLAAYQPTHKM